MKTLKAYGQPYLVIYDGRAGEYEEFCRTGTLVDTCPVCGEHVTDEMDSCQCGVLVVWDNARNWKDLFGKPKSAIEGSRFAPIGECERAMLKVFGATLWARDIVSQLNKLRSGAEFDPERGREAATKAIAMTKSRGAAAQRAAIGMLLKHEPEVTKDAPIF